MDGVPFSHTYIRFYSQKYDRWLIYQADGLKVNFIGQRRFEDGYKVYDEFVFHVDDDTMKSVMQFAIDNVGAPYNLKAVLGIAIVKVAALFGKKIEKNPLTGSGFFCSLIVGDILVEKLGSTLPGDPNLWTPRVIYETLDKGI
jgi:hypothetical protein